MSGHDLDPVSLVFGAVFALLGLAFLLLPVDAASIHLERVWPVMVMAMGLLIVALSARGSRRRREPVAADRPSPSPEPGEDEPGDESGDEPGDGHG